MGSSTPNTLNVEILGATGYVGQHLVSLLAEHPWFRLGRLAASGRSAGKPYHEAASWSLPHPMPGAAGHLMVEEPDPSGEPRIVFSALDRSAAMDLEIRYAEMGHLVISNAGAHRLDPAVPLVVPEINPDHLELLSRQAWKGWLATNPNCSTIGLCLALKPLQDQFGLGAVHTVTLQALSGAGIPGVPSLAITDNVLPFIPGEEEKIEAETKKILGTLASGKIRHAEFPISAACNRVPVTDGHSESVGVRLGEQPGTEAIVRAWERFSGFPQAARLPSAPARPLTYSAENLQPQPRSARSLGGGMGVGIGRLRTCPVLDYKFAISFHNAIRGAAGGTILLAETILVRGDTGFRMEPGLP